MSGPAWDRLRSMAENERPRADAIREAIAELEDVREWADVLTRMAEALDTIASSVDEWADAEREFKPDARDTLLADLSEFTDALTDAEALSALGFMS